VCVCVCACVCVYVCVGVCVRVCVIHRYLFPAKWGLVLDIGCVRASVCVGRVKESEPHTLLCVVFAWYYICVVCQCVCFEVSNTRMTALLLLVILCLVLALAIDALVPVVLPTRAPTHTYTHTHAQTHTHTHTRFNLLTNS
jgi:uncharacterized membrane protein